MSNAKVLLDAADLLIKLAKQENTLPDPRLDQIVAVWDKMKQQFDNDTKPHSWVDWGAGVLPDQAGTNEPESPFYEKFKNFWKAMERQRVLDQTGTPFIQLLRIREGGNKLFEDAVKFLAKTPEGKAWFGDPLNANYLPKPQDMLLLFN